MNRTAFWPWLRPFLILVCVVAAPLVVYFFGYVQHSVMAHRQQSFTTLAAVATELSARLTAYDKIAQNASAIRSPVASPSNTLDLEAPLKSYLGTVIKAKYFAVPMGKSMDSASTAELHLEKHLELDQSGAGLRLQVGYPCPQENSGPCNRSNSVRLTTLVPLENLVPWDMVQTDFDGMLVLNSKGELVAQDRRLPAQPLAVSVKLALAGDNLNVGWLFPDGKLAKPEAPTQNRAAGNSLDIEALHSPLSFHDDVLLQIAGVDYVAFLQPLRMPITVVGGIASQTKGEPLDMVVCGLVRQDRMRSEALALSPATLVTVSVIVAFGLFAIPFLKLRFIGPRERMRQRDVWLLACAALCTTAAGTLLVLERHTVSVLQERFDNGLRGFTASVVKNSVDERQLVIKQLYESREKLLSSGFSADRSKVAAVLAAPDHREFSYPSFEALYAVDLDRRQVIKWMPRTVLTPMVVAQIDIAPTLSLVSAEDSSASSASAMSATFQTTVASTTGLLLASFSIPAHISADSMNVDAGPHLPLQQRNGVLTLSTPFASLNAPLVASPFQFVVVDRKGGLIMKSAAGPYRDERFFDAVSDGAALQRAAQQEVPGGNEQKIVGSYLYRGSTYRMRAVELPHLNAFPNQNAYLVTYYAQDVVETLAARMMVGGALFALGIIASVLLGAAIARCWLGERAFDWAWPSPALTSHYFFGIVACCLIVAIVLVAYCWLAVHVAAWLFAAFLLSMPGIAIIAVSRFTHRCRATSFRVRLQRVADWMAARAGADTWIFTAFAVVSLLTFVALPTLLAYNDIATLYRAAYADSVASGFKSDAEKRSEQLLSGVVLDVSSTTTPMCGASSLSDTLDMRCAAPERERLYASKINYDRLVNLQATLGIYDNCIDIAPNQRCSLREPSTAPWSFTLGVLQHSRKLGGSALWGSSLANIVAKEGSADKFQRVSAGFSLTVWNVGAGLLLIVGLALLVRSIAKNVLGLGLVGDGVLPREHDFKPADATRWLLLRPAAADVHHSLRACQSKKTVDLRDPFLKSSDLPTVDMGVGSTLLLTHAECRLADRDWRSILLQVLAAPRLGCLVVVSEIDPLHFLAQRLRETVALANALETTKRELLNAECTKLGDELMQFAIALRHVEKIRRAPFDFSTDAQRNVSAELYGKIAAECRWSEPLIHIGTMLVARADLAEYCWGQIVDFIRDAAEPYYRSQWDLCSRDEKLVMLQLAQEGVVNPKSIDSVKRLARRRLVLVDPRFRLMNESFCKFVRDAELPEHIVQWEHAGYGTTWSRLQTPIYALATVIVAILLYTEQGMASSVVAIATGAAGKIGSFRNFYAAIKPALSTGGGLS